MGSYNAWTIVIILLSLPQQLEISEPSTEHHYLCFTYGRTEAQSSETICLWSRSKANTLQWFKLFQSMQLEMGVNRGTQFSLA